MLPLVFNYDIYTMRVDSRISVVNMSVLSRYPGQHLASPGGIPGHVDPANPINVLLWPTDCQLFI